MVCFWNKQELSPRTTHSSNTNRWLWTTAPCSWSRTPPSLMSWLPPTFMVASSPTSALVSLEELAWHQAPVLETTTPCSHRECLTQEWTLLERILLTPLQSCWAQWWCWDIWVSPVSPTRSLSRSQRPSRRARWEPQTLEETAPPLTSPRKSFLTWNDQYENYLLNFRLSVLLYWIYKVDGTSLSYLWGGSPLRYSQTMLSSKQTATIDWIV